MQKFSLVIFISGLTLLHGSSVLIADNSMSNMIELTSKSPFCRIHRDRGVIRAKLLASDQRRVRQMTDDSIAKLMAVCNTDTVRSAHQGGFIYPGTKWCGPGNNALDYSDLGYHSKEDRCCREHDHCSMYLLPGHCERGICNKSPYTRSHCDCDAKFRKCLQNVNSETANTIGAIFFNVIQIICFKERTPCSEIHGVFPGIKNQKYYCPLTFNAPMNFPVSYLPVLKSIVETKFVKMILKKFKIT